MTLTPILRSVLESSAQVMVPLSPFEYRSSARIHRSTFGFTVLALALTTRGSVPATRRFMWIA